MDKSMMIRTGGRLVSKFALRVISAAVLAPLFLLVVYLGQLPFAALCTAIIWLCAMELSGMRPKELGSPGSSDIIAPALVTVLLLATQFMGARALFVAPPAILLSAAPAWFRPETDSADLTRDMCWRALSAAYLGLIVFWLLLRGRPDGLEYFILAISATWLNDILAYFVGKALGRKRISPAVSPNKTYAGAAAGLLAGGAAGAIFALVVGFSALALTAAGMLLAATAQLGDLFASMLKRAGRIDDSGNMIPGHGGVLDRLDGLLFSVPVLFLLLELGIL